MSTSTPTSTSSSSSHLCCRYNFSKTSEEALNKQINMELFASYTYQSIASWCARDEQALTGFAKYYGHKAEEEREHAQKLINYMSMRGGKVCFESIKEPGSEWGCALNILEAVFNLECSVNKSLLGLHKIASESCDPQFEDFLEGEFLKEQVEDLKRTADNLTQLKRAGGEGLGLYLFDQQLAREASSL